MPPNLRCVAAQGWRSIGSRRNLSSSPGSNGEKHVTVPASNRVVSYLNTFSIATYMTTGFTSYGLIELFLSFKFEREMERQHYLINELLDKRVLRSEMKE